jgi:hypothetical protein
MSGQKHSILTEERRRQARDLVVLSSSPSSKALTQADLRCYEIMQIAPPGVSSIVTWGGTNF